MLNTTTTTNITTNNNNKCVLAWALVILVLKVVMQNDRDFWK